MNYYKLKISGLIRRLPIIPLKKGIMVASFNLLGDGELVEVLARDLVTKLGNIEFDYLIGPEVKVVPLLQELSRILGKKRYIVCRKEIHGYMVKPVKSNTTQALVIDGNDARLLPGAKVVIVDDVVSSGGTMESIQNLMQNLNATVISKIAIFEQGTIKGDSVKDLIYLKKLPIFTS